jgi:hypothetical protein
LQKKKAQELADVNAVLEEQNIALNPQKKSLESFIQAAARLTLKPTTRHLRGLSQWIQEDSPNLRDSEDYFDLLNERILRMEIIINELLKSTQIEAWMGTITAR